MKIVFTPRLIFSGILHHPQLILLSLYHHIRYSSFPVLVNPSWSPLVLAFQTPSVVTGRSTKPFGMPFWPPHFFGAGTFSSSLLPGPRPFASLAIQQKTWASRLPYSQCSLQCSLFFILTKAYPTTCSLGTVLGFVISYRTTSSFERYNEGRRYWSQIVFSTRTLARLIWFHVPGKCQLEHT